MASLAVPAVSMANPGNSANSHASACGTIHAAQADANGNFGWLGSDGGASDNGTTPPGQASGGNANAVASQSC